MAQLTGTVVIPLSPIMIKTTFYLKPGIIVFP